MGLTVWELAYNLITKRSYLVTLHTGLGGLGFAAEDAPNFI